MAEKAICKIDGCGKRSRNRGWCSAHYERWRKYGDPHRGGPIGTSHGEPIRYFFDVVVPYSGEECLIWPYALSKGYGAVHFQGRKHTVSRLLCEIVNGPPPSPNHQAAHICGNGANGCVAVTHLRWKTPTENQNDRISHGTHNRGERYGGSKLTDELVREIRCLLPLLSQRKIARQFGITQQTVSDIKNGISWAWLK